MNVDGCFDKRVNFGESPRVHIWYDCKWLEVGRPNERGEHVATDGQVFEFNDTGGVWVRKDERVGE
jgi:hypothetical protein